MGEWNHNAKLDQLHEDDGWCLEERIKERKAGVFGEGTKDYQLMQQEEQIKQKRKEF